MPNMTRLGVTIDNMLTLSLTDAVKRALENNNDIEVARDDCTVRGNTTAFVEGVYDPFLSFTPQYDKRISPQASRFSGQRPPEQLLLQPHQFNPAISNLFNWRR
jgi:hypothetical protein